MVVTYQTLTLSNASATTISLESSELVEHDIELYVQNLSDTAYVCIGDSAVTSNSFGMRLGPNDSMTFDYRGYDSRPTFYGISSQNNSQVSVFRVQR